MQIKPICEPRKLFLFCPCEVLFLNIIQLLLDISELFKEFYVNEYQFFQHF